MDDELLIEVALGLACRELANHIPETPEQIRKDLIQRAQRAERITVVPVNIEIEHAALVLASCELSPIEQDLPYKIRLRFEIQAQELLKGLINV